VTTLVVETTEGVEIRLDLAGAGSRYAAGLLDGIILAIGSMLLFFALAMIGSADASGFSGFLIGIFLGGMFFLVIGYHVAFHVFDKGCTPGKRMLGIRVVATDGRPATPFQILVRALIQPIDILFAVPVSIGLILIAATPRSQRLGDLAAGTMVVRAVVHPYVPDPFPGETWTTLPFKSLPLTPGLVAKLSPDDRAYLRALVTRQGLIGDARRDLFVKSAHAMSEKLGLGPFTDARDVLKELYLYLREFPPQPAA
jgi:uncharacterized RDD family membrane protein YckC